MSVPAEPYKDPAYLRHAYNTLEQSQKEIVWVCGVTPGTISRWMLRFQIPTRGKSRPAYTDEELVEAASDCIDELGYFPSSDVFHEMANISTGTVNRHFGSWLSFLDAVEDSTDWERARTRKPPKNKTFREKVEESKDQLEKATTSPPEISFCVCPRCQRANAYERDGRIACRDCGGYTLVEYD